MRFLIFVFAILAVVFAVHPIIHAIMNGVLCKPCENLISNGENNTEGDITTWLNKQIQAICAPMGILKNECIKEFQAKEQQIIDAINNKADPHAACHDMDFCD